ncbi:DUF1285 domain-containing protein [Glaciecola sp. MH2013]|uniref:DUF1285 domain-containing protein n=1 Tax=Glaciecola sp. MH2013 TaxID=2785524 RepID=UPI0018A095D2|nr:DUF1285 domain-containing protein [Glaciecola sp. MH2013]MBF7074476.1 DUF1285 domain-containing protein [Glaciecola sp. MH2013]
MDLGAIAQQLKEVKQGLNSQALPPVDDWNPEFCGNMNLVIKANGQWWHEGSPFTRAALVSLLASVLKKEADDYFLVTPVEKIGISVEDVPFIIGDWQQDQHVLTVTTQLGDSFVIDDSHPVELREYKDVLVPYCLVRRNLWARLHQNVLYQWVELARERTTTKSTELVINSGDYEFVIGRY